MEYNAPLFNQVHPTNEFLNERNLNMVGSDGQTIYRDDCRCWFCEGIRFEFLFEEVIESSD